jgi:energy-converting hydrogenase A subunit R
VCQVDTDCEGPIVLNDNALELAAHFIPEGEDFFAKLSGYDDYLAGIVKKPGYRAGSTLAMILPFLKAFGASNKKIEYYSLYHIKMLPGAIGTFKYIQSKMPLFLISASYSPFALALGQKLGVPPENVYSTKMDIDQYKLSAADAMHLKQLAKEILSLPPLNIPASVTSADYLAPQVKSAISRLDQIIWQEVMSMECGRVLSEVNPVGGIEKANALKDSVKRTDSALSEVMFIGDSITDLEALELAKENQGLAVSFNGNSYAVSSAEIACISSNTIVTAVLAEVFFRKGREGVLAIAANWSPSALRESDIDSDLMGRFFATYKREFPLVEVINESTKDRLIEQSETFRKILRGKAGMLG